MSVDRSVHGQLGDHLLSTRSRTNRDVNSSTDADGHGDDCAHKMSDKQLVQFHVQKELEKSREKRDGEVAAAPQSKTRRFPARTMGRLINGLIRVKKDDLDAYFDFGNPIGIGRGSNVEDAIVIYQNQKSLPSTTKDNMRLAHSAEYVDASGIPLTDPKTATENCDAMNVIFTGNPGNVRQCTAIIANLESYHVQRWMKVNVTRSSRIEEDLPLSLVSRGYAAKRGRSNFYAPPFDGRYSPVKQHWKSLLTFFTYLDSVLEDLRPILAKVARNNAVVVMTCNMGQSALLMNFACSARRRGFDLGNILVFPSDVKTKELAEGLGMATYYDEKVGSVGENLVFPGIPSYLHHLLIYFCLPQCSLKEYGTHADGCGEKIRR